jgi:23S rRNA (uracil1939-C5)-methyltransferase
VDVTPERMVAGGLALARGADGRVVLVDGAVPGERVRIAVTAERSDHQRAKVVEVLDASPQRVEPPCPFARAGCGGCGWQHVAVDTQRTYKRDIIVDALHRIARIDDPPLRPTVELANEGYRTTVRVLAVDGRAAFRKHASHDPVVVDSCMVAHPLVDDVLKHGRFGDAREVVVRAGARTGERCVYTDPADAHIDVAADVRRGPKAHVHEIVNGVRLRVGARSFFQARPDGADALARLVRDAVGPHRVVADLYAGVGLFAATVDRPARVIAVEHDRFAVGDARHNLHERAAHVLELDVARWRPERVDVVVADPSRTGLGKPGAKTVLATHAERVVLVSCDAATLARDIAMLEHGGYRLRSMTPVDLFPHTPHIECVSVLER